ncbi:MAG: hypothetical protein HOV87_34130 [Catenulispora sp.]|nr:hypothetical protein [Catenulispora sp.]
MTPVLPASGQAPEGGFTDPEAGADDDGAADEEAFDAVFLEDAADEAEEGAEADEVAAAPEDDDGPLVWPVCPAWPAAPLGVAAPVEVRAAPVCDGSEPAASVAAESEPHPLTAAATRSTIATAVPAVGVRDTLANVPSSHERSHQNSVLSKG